MGYKLKQCVVIGVFNPSILLEGWVSADIDEVLLCSGKDVIWRESYTNKDTKANYFFVHVPIPKKMSVRFLLLCNGLEVEAFNIATHIGIRGWSKFQSLFKKESSEPFSKSQTVGGLPSVRTYNPLIAAEYQQWIEKTSIKAEVPLEFVYNPLISIVIPVYNIEREYLSQCIESVLYQTYPNFEICIADDCSSLQETVTTLREYEKKDPRIKICYRKKNGHISVATNSALDLANGEYVGFLDHDDMLNRHALEEVVKALNQDNTIDFIYSDEDKLDVENKRREPHFKPDFSIDNLLSANYICHFTVLRRELINEINGFREGYEGAQDYDLFLRAIEKTEKIYHIPQVLYQWRQIPGSTALDGESKNYAANSGLRAIEDYIHRNNIRAYVKQIVGKISYRVTYMCEKESIVDVVLLYDGNLSKLKRVIDEWLIHMVYHNYNFVILSSHHVEKNDLREYKDIVNIQWIDGIVQFNQYVTKSSCEYLVFWDVNNIIRDADWLKVIVSYASNDKIGAVGSNMVNSYTGEFVSGYVIVNQHKIIPVKKWYIAMGDAPVNRCIVGCLGYAVSKEHFEEVGGFCAELDVFNMHMDLQMKLHNYLRRNIVVPQVCFMREEAIGWEEVISDLPSMKEFVNDPSYNPNLSKEIAYQL